MPQVMTQPGEVIKPDSWKVIDQEGMPIESSPYEKGNLYIQFDVKFPDSLTPQQVQALTQVMAAVDHVQCYAAWIHFFSVRAAGVCCTGEPLATVDCVEMQDHKCSCASAGAAEGADGERRGDAGG